MTQTALATAVAQQAPLPQASFLPHTFAELQGFAEDYARSNLCPSAYRGKPYDILAAAMQGRELGLNPMQSCASIAMINGKPSIYGEAVNALIMRADPKNRIECLTEGEGDELVGICRYYRVSNNQSGEVRFSVQDAKTAKLWGKAGPWSQYPKRMLMRRALGYVARDIFADALQGVQIAEEQQDIALAAKPAVTIAAPGQTMVMPGDEPDAIDAPEPPAQDEQANFSREDMLRDFGALVAQINDLTELRHALTEHRGYAREGAPDDADLIKEMDAIASERAKQIQEGDQC